MEKKFGRWVKEAFKNLTNYLLEIGLMSENENLSKISQIEVFAIYHRIVLPDKKIEWFLSEYQNGSIQKFISELNVKIPKFKDTSKQKVANKFKKDLINRATKAEKKFLSMLKKINRQIELNFTFQKTWTAGNGFYISDFYFPDSQTTIEIDGEYHNDEKQQEKDLKKEQYLLKRHVRTLRLTNKEVFNLNVNSLINKLIVDKVLLL